MTMFPLQDYLDEFFFWINNTKLPSLTWNLGKVAAAVSTAFVVICFVAIFTKKFYFNPLSKFPGPRLTLFSNINYSISYLSGRQPYNVLKLHEKYGPVVRVAPNELSFNSAQAWKDIYGHRKGHSTFVKSHFYDGGNFANQAHSIVSERDPVKHSKMRKYLSSAFSDRSLKEQEYLVADKVDEFIDQIGKSGSAPSGIDMTFWFNLLTFDIIGELAFGKSFDGLKTGTNHFWVTTVLESMSQSSFADTLGRFPSLGRLVIRFNQGWLKKLLEGSARHEQYTLNLIRKRIKEKTDRKDFMSYLLSPGLENVEGEFATIQLAAHASDFIIAGSETTATTLAVVTYYLCHDTEMLKKLQNEIRSAFQAYDEINSSTIADLRYLHALCLEALRIYPPLPLALPRVVPVGGDTVDGHFVPEGTIVATNPFAASLAPTNFHNPWKFDPDRWLGLNKPDQLEASQPFSMGSRGCIGRGLGLLELKVTLAKLHFRYDLTLLNTEMDWHRDSRMHLLWKKPPLMIQISPASFYQTKSSTRNGQPRETKLV